ncbi:MAG TPA: hypothetical protein VGS58_03125 [Candidatus Sulfopaludibacter sp.]|nr:hypothetical protein [Candidatus Sulfopaludibacter sp.]
MVTPLHRCNILAAGQPASSDYPIQFALVREKAGDCRDAATTRELNGWLATETTIAKSLAPSHIGAVRPD